MKTVIILALMCLNTFAFQPIQIIDQPTAGLLNKGVLTIDMRSYNPNALLTEIYYAPFTRIQLGLSYGATNLIGSDTIQFNGLHIGYKLKLRPLEEGIYNPALAIGFDSQGYGSIVTDYNEYERFQYQSAGAYLVISKSFMFWMFSFGLHGITNYTLERDTLPSFFDGLNYAVALDFGLLTNLYVLSEYNFLVGDTDIDGYNDVDTGLLNIGVRWNILNNFSCSLHFKDFLGVNDELGYTDTSFDREIRLTYFNSFK